MIRRSGDVLANVRSVLTLFAIERSRTGDQGCWRGAHESVAKPAGASGFLRPPETDRAS